ncbi:MAG: 6-bladed beta-propeller [Rhodocyclaceae bacterium]|nr:6-bladed beta-propeller [Rhodocyclaceae bacterium]
MPHSIHLGVPIASRVSPRGTGRGFTGILNWILLAGAILLLGACASVGDSSADKEEPIQTAWPNPPDAPRYVFQTFLRTLADVRPESDEDRLQKMLTGVGVGDKLVYERPASIAARDGRIYVADPQTSSVVVFDVPRRKIFRFGERPPNTLGRPNSIAIDDASRIYVLDSKAKSVLVFDALGLYQFRVGKPEDFTKPVGLAVSGDGRRIYVVDRGGLQEDDHKVVVYSPDGSIVQKLGPRGGEDGQFNIPLEAAVAPDGSLVILDSGNFRVQIFDSEGRFVRAFGSVGNGMGQFSRPRGLAVDGNANIYVADASFNNVQVFDMEGHLLMAIGKPSLRGGPGEYALVGAVAADRNGFVYVADNFFKKIEVYQQLPDGQAAPPMQKK